MPTQQPPPDVADVPRTADEADAAEGADASDPAEVADPAVVPPIDVRAALPMVDQQPVERSDAARNRQRILQAARQLIDRQGVEALTMNAVAAEARLGVGTVYRRFGDQAGLVDALMNDRETELQRQLLAGPPPLGPGAEPLVRIRAFLHARVDLLEAYAPVLATVGQSARLRHRGRGAYAVHHQHLVVLIGQARPELDAHFLADALLANLDPVRYLARRRELGYSVQRIKDGLDQLVAGLG